MGPRAREIAGSGDRLQSVRAPIVCVSRVVGDQALKKSTEKFLRWADMEVSPFEVARYYRSILSRLEGMIIDEVDREDTPRIETLGIRVQMRDTVMRGPGKRAASLPHRYSR